MEELERLLLGEVQEHRKVQEAAVEGLVQPQDRMAVRAPREMEGVELAAAVVAADKASVEMEAMEVREGLGSAAAAEAAQVQLWAKQEMEAMGALQAAAAAAV